jgi:CPA1 family monovalent cation:H+ antiporter
LVVQATSLPWIVKRLKIAQVSSSQQQVEELQAQLMTAKAAQDELETLLKGGVLPKAIYEELRAAYQVRVAGAEKALRNLYNRRPDQFAITGNDHTKLDAIRRRLLLAEKGTLNEALRKRILAEEVVRERLKMIDEQLLRLEDD